MVESAAVGTDMVDAIGREGNASPDWIREFQTPIELSSSSPSTSLSLDDVGKAKGCDKLDSDWATTTSTLRSTQLEIDKSTGSPNFKQGVVLLTDSGDEAPTTIQSKQNSREGKLSASQKHHAVTVGQIKEHRHKKRDEKPFLVGKKAADVSVAKHGESKLDVLQEADEDEDDDDTLPLLGASKKKGEAKIQREKSTPSNEELLHEHEFAGEQDRRQRPRITSTLPLVFADKVHTSKVLVECEGNALDLSGDVGAVGRFSANTIHEKNSLDLLLDLKGILYKAAIIPSNSFFVVNMGPSEAKVEAIMNDFLQLQPATNSSENETLIEGTLEGLMFDSEDEGERRQVLSESGIDANQKTMAKEFAGKQKNRGTLSKAKDKTIGTKVKASKKPSQKKSTKASLSKNLKARK
ncbi:hypothetical protein O6H91_12G065800 [Diphasiastrum complanatum]|uniref:Uncharacterized protein n=1 Tax=Diphasiastrum complanatum TaxID=34168 RepID=A0ACC2C2W1_DIPCM|nr:hypothetical protein O6H91_12G065800 [Diphasiastrum complanatum]